MLVRSGGSTVGRVLADILMAWLSEDEIDVKELQQVLTYVGIPIELEECTEVANIVDLDDSGFVDFQDVYGWHVEVDEIIIIYT